MKRLTSAQLFDAPKSARKTKVRLARAKLLIIAARKRAATLYVDRTAGRWVVRDPEGNLWSLPSTDNPWDERQPFSPTEETELEPVPGHYKHMLGLPL